MPDYATVAGFIQFDVNERDVNGQEVRDVTVRAIGTQKLVKVTVWSDFSDVPLAKGDFIVADGKFSTNEGQAKDGTPITYLNLSASNLLRLEPAERAEREVVNRPSSSSGKAPF